MGLDTVEIVMWAEEEFEISISDEEASGILTVGEFAKFLSNKSKVDYEVCFIKIGNLLVSDYSINSLKISADSRFVQDLGLD